jgi:DNA-binding HxlR family transcriptional regulator
MGRTADYSNESCTVAAALSVVGDPWTLLILRDAFGGSTRFEQWQSKLGVARNVLAARLKSLVAHGVLTTRLYSEHPPRREYTLTHKGRDLLPVLLTLHAWGERHVYGHDCAPREFIHSCGARLEPRLTCAACEAAVTGRDLRVEEFETQKTVGEALTTEA